MTSFGAKMNKFVFYSEILEYMYVMYAYMTSFVVFC